MAFGYWADEFGYWTDEVFYRLELVHFLLLLFLMHCASQIVECTNLYRDEVERSILCLTFALVFLILGRFYKSEIVKFPHWVEKTEVGCSLMHLEITWMYLVNVCSDRWLEMSFLPFPIAIHIIANTALDYSTLIWMCRIGLTIYCICTSTTLSLGGHVD